MFLGKQPILLVVGITRSRHVEVQPKHLGGYTPDPRVSSGICRRRQFASRPGFGHPWQGNKLSLRAASGFRLMALPWVTFWLSLTPEDLHRHFESMLRYMREVREMIDIIEQNRDELIALCEANEIKGLWLFGSAVTGNWDPDRSDLDFLFDIGEYDKTAARRWMDLNAGLIRLFGEDLDLVSRPAIKRDDFKRRVEQTAVPIYER